MIVAFILIYYIYILSCSLVGRVCCLIARLVEDIYGAVGTLMSLPVVLPFHRGPPRSTILVHGGYPLNNLIYDSISMLFTAIVPQAATPDS